MALTSTVVVDVDLPQAEVGRLFADPRNSTRWMLDLDRYEPLTGEEGMPGSTYRLVPRTGNLVFVATVVARDPPRELRVSLQSAKVHVDIVATLSPLSSARTRLTSVEVFTFGGLFGALVPLLASRTIKHAHRSHIEEFKRFAERQA